MNDFCPKHGANLCMCYDCVSEPFQEEIEALEKQIEEFKDKEIDLLLMLEHADRRIEALKNPEIVLPKITHEMVEYLEPELIAFDEDGITYWKQVAVDFAGFLKIKSN